MSGHGTLTTTTTNTYAIRNCPHRCQPFARSSPIPSIPQLCHALDRPPVKVQDSTKPTSKTTFPQLTVQSSNASSGRPGAATVYTISPPTIPFAKDLLIKIRQESLPTRQPLCSLVCRVRRFASSRGVHLGPMGSDPTKSPRLCLFRQHVSFDIKTGSITLTLS